MKIISGLRHDYFNIELIYSSTLVVLLLIISISYTDISNKFGLLGSGDKIDNGIYFEFIGSTPQAEARSYIVYDIVDKKVLYAKRENEVLPLASITKLMTAVTALEIAEASTLIYIDKSHIENTYDIGLTEGQLWRLDELVKYMLVYSSNDAANAISNTLVAKREFIKKMNEIGEREGMTTLKFTNSSGLDNELIYGGQGSALDVAKLMAYAYKNIPAVIDSTTKPKAIMRTSSGPLTGVPNTNSEVEKYIGLAGSKTGFTDEAGGNLTIVFDIALGRPIVIVVLGSTRANRFSDVERLYEITKNALK